jgi:hypothetical protein
MSNPAPAARSLAFTVAGIVLGTSAFAAAYGQAPLYYSNQNQYFLHGLAIAGQGILHEDWLANTADPTPIFSALVAATASVLPVEFFHFEYALLLAVYAAALLGLFVALAGPELAARRWPAFLALLVLVHSALARWLSYRLFALDYPWYFQSGVAGQYVLGAMFQPSTFGILLVAAVCLFARGRDVAAVVCAALGATIHSTYLLPAGLLTAGFVTACCVEKRIRHAALLGALALVLVLPVTAYVLSNFRPSSPETFAEAQEILVHLRIPHHCLPELWFDSLAAIQVAWVGLALALLWGTRLFPALAVTTGLATILTVAQLVSGSDTLALLFPWRISAVLVPVATAVILARLVALRALPLERTADWVLSGLAIASAAVTGVGICAGGWAFRSGDDELPLMDYVHDHRQPDDVYLLPVRVPDLQRSTHGSPSGDFKPVAQKRQDTRLIPPDLQRFRLYTGAPIFVDFKAIPYKDTDVVEWRDRLRLAKSLYEQLQDDRAAHAVAEMGRLGVTHVVVRAGTVIRAPGLARLPFDNAQYAIYRLEGRKTP